MNSGDSLGPYLIDSALGAGGMGRVYLARDTRLNRKVALKQLSDSSLAGDEARGRVIPRSARRRRPLASQHRDDL